MHNEQNLLLLGTQHKQNTYTKLAQDIPELMVAQQINASQHFGAI